MSLLVKPIGQSQITSGAAIAPAANALVAEIQALPPGWYLITGATGTNGASGVLANMKLIIGGAGSLSELGRLASTPVPAAFEFVTWIGGNSSVRILAVAADAGSTYVVQNLTVTPIEAPEQR